VGLTSLLVSAEADAVQILSRNLEEIGVEVETTGDLQRASHRIAERRYDAVLVDCSQETEAIDLIARTRETFGARECIVIAIVDGENRVRDILAKGADFALYKPISVERAAHSLAAMRGLLRSERRIQPRIPLHSTTAIAYGATENSGATLLDLNESGLGMQASDRLPPKCRVYFQFAVPGNSATVRLAGEMMWQDSTGRVGIRFGNLPQASKRILRDWFQASTCAQEESEKATPANNDDSKERLSAGLGLLSAAAGDRRKPERRGCCLGAQVYRAENNVPIRCNLTDISSGGCYVETTEPFSVGTPVEIVVHTQELKLCLSGRVRSANRGFGMGVEFVIRNAQQKSHIEQLINHAKAESKLLG